MPRLKSDYFAMDARFLHQMSLQTNLNSVFNMFETRKSIYAKYGNVAEISVSGPLNMGDYFSFSTSYDDIKAAVREATEDPDIEEVEFYWDSPGGTLYGLKECGLAIGNLSKVKSTKSYIKQMCCSAAYWLVSFTNYIESGAHSEQGGVGVYKSYMDNSAAIKAQGYDIKFISSGDEKGHPSDGVKISEAFLKAEDEKVKSLGKEFFALVKANRPNVSNDIVFQGGTFLGEKALELGLIDSIGEVNFLDNNNNFCKERLMKKNPEDDNVITTEQAEEFKALAKTEGIAEGIAEGVAKGQLDNMNLFNGLLEEFPDNQDFAIKCFKDNKTIDEAKLLYVDVVQNEKAALMNEKKDLEAKLLAASKSVAPDATPPNPEDDDTFLSAGGEPGAALSEREQAKLYKDENNCTMREAFAAVKKSNMSV